MINEQFVSTILHLLLNDSSLTIFKKIVNILKKMLTTSDHVKLISNMSFDRVIQPGAIPDKDLQFIRHLIDYLYNKKDKYQACTH